MMRQQKFLSSMKARCLVSVWQPRLATLAVLLSVASTAFAAPIIPIYHNTLDDLASAEALGGELMRNANPGAGYYVDPSFVPGVVGNKLLTGTRNQGDNTRASTAAWLKWGSSEVQAIFGTNAAPIYKDDDGITIDLYFSGISSSAPGPGNTGEHGLWSVGHRGSNDNFVMLGVQNGTLRFNLRNDATPSGNSAPGTSFAWVIPNPNLIAAQTYRVTVRQREDLNNGVPELYLDDLDDSISTVYDGPTHIPWVTPNPAGFPANYRFNFPLENGSGGSAPQALGMTIGSRYPFHEQAGQANANGNSEIYNGMSIDDVKIYNGAYTPAEIDYVPEPSSLCLFVLGLFVPSLIRRRH